MSKYCVVRLNSTSGPWVVETTSTDNLKPSRASIHSVEDDYQRADIIAKRLNFKEEHYHTDSDAARIVCAALGWDHDVHPVAVAEIPGALYVTGTALKPREWDCLYDLDGHILEVNGEKVIVIFRSRVRCEVGPVINGYYHCADCGYNNLDISDVFREPCWGCGGTRLELRGV